MQQAPREIDAIIAELSTYVWIRLRQPAENHRRHIYGGGRLTPGVEVELAVLPVSGGAAAAPIYTERFLPEDAASDFYNRVQTDMQDRGYHVVGSALNADTWQEAGTNA